MHRFARRLLEIEGFSSGFFARRHADARNHRRVRAVHRDGDHDGRGRFCSGEYLHFQRELAKARLLFSNAVGERHGFFSGLRGHCEMRVEERRLPKRGLRGLFLAEHCTRGSEPHVALERLVALETTFVQRLDEKTFGLRKFRTIPRIFREIERALASFGACPEREQKRSRRQRRKRSLSHDLARCIGYRPVAARATSGERLRRASALEVELETAC